VFQAIGVGVNAMLGYTEAGSEFASARWEIDGGFGVVSRSVLPIIIFIASFFPSVITWASCNGSYAGMAIGMQGDGRERRRIAERGGQHLHGADRSALTIRRSWPASPNRSCSR